MASTHPLGQKRWKYCQTFQLIRIDLMGSNGNYFPKFYKYLYIHKMGEENDFSYYQIENTDIYIYKEEDINKLRDMIWIAD